MSKPNHKRKHVVQFRADKNKITEGPSFSIPAWMVTVAANGQSAKRKPGRPRKAINSCPTNPAGKAPAICDINGEQANNILTEFLTNAGVIYDDVAGFGTNPRLVQLGVAFHGGCMTDIAEIEKRKAIIKKWLAENASDPSAAKTELTAPINKAAALHTVTGGDK